MGKRDFASRLAASQAVAEALLVDPARAGTLRLADALGAMEHAPETGTAVDSVPNPETLVPVVVIAGESGKCLAVIPPVVANVHLSKT